MNHLGFIAFVATLVVLLALKYLNALTNGVAEKGVSISASIDDGVKLWMRVAVSLLVLIVSLYVVVNPHSQSDQQKWAFGAIGTLLGYWLKS